VQDVSQPEQPVSLVAVQAALSNCPAGQVGLHVSHAVWPVVLAKVPGPQPMQAVLACDDWKVPAGQSGQLLDPAAGWEVPAGQFKQSEAPGVDVNWPALQLRHVVAPGDDWN